MPNKLVVIFSFVFLAITQAYAASPEQPNSVSIDQNSRQNEFGKDDPVVSPNSVVADSNSRLTYFQRKIEDANKGDPNAQYYLGLTYYLGEDKYVKDVRQDYNEALKWYTKAAEQGNPDAQQSLGEMYYNGEGVPKDYIEAAKWFRKSAEQGNADAQQTLGEMYYEGEGVPQDYNEALKLLTKCIQGIERKWKDYPRIASFQLKYTYFTLGTMYYNGEGTTQDYKEAVKWWTKAAENGIAEAQFNLGLMCFQGQGFPIDFKTSATWYTKAAEQGDASAQRMLGVMYINGYGVQKDYKEAVKWFTESAEQGQPNAQAAVASMYYEGKGVIEDYVVAYKWALLAGMNGIDVTGIKQNLADKMTYTQISEAQKLAKEFVAKKKNVKDKESFGLEERTSPKASGTGFFISPSGYIITAAHVVEKSRSLKIFSSVGMSQAKVVLLDEPTDVAILKVDGAEFPYLEVISSSTVNVGDKIFTIGFPNVPVQGTEPKYTDGTISSLSGIDNNVRHFQISIPVQPGNSGGPLLSAKGEVIGVIVSRLDDIGMLEATGTLPQNVNYAVKSAFILPLLENLPSWQNPKAKPNDEKKSNTEIINKARNAVALILVY